MVNGNNGSVAIKKLDEVRRPFLDIHNAESFLLSDGYSKTIHENLKHGMDRGRHLIADFKTVSSYNQELLERVEKLANTFEEWINTEHVLFGEFAKNGSTNIGLVIVIENLNILAATSKYFSLTMSLLGEAEAPIHNDIHDGSKATIELIISSGILLFCCVCMVFLLQWFKIKERKKAEQNIKLINESLEYRIAERKKMEDTLLQSEKLKSLGIITAGISHEFNNILNVISGSVQLMEMNYNGNSELMGYFSTIMRAVDDGAAITGNMLKITKTKNTSESVPFDLNELLKQSIEFTKPRWKNMAQANGIDYFIDQKGMKNVSQLLCDPTEMREVFTSIINNALDAMPDGGSISFCTWSKEDNLFVSISDTGKGMAKEVKKRIFDPFFTTRCPEGAGLGMSIAYGIITRHGGKIEVESELGKGSVFTLQFPTTNKKVSPTATPEPEQEINIKNLRILVVDDEEAFCDILDRFLSSKGHNVKTVDNGADAIKIIKAEDFDLILSDLGMSGVNGYDVAMAINKLEKRPKIGIITGWGEKLEQFDEVDTKVDFILKKPFKNTDLTKHINDAFSTDSR
jgi:signal transduction histidine kinase/ActR/RegA family two-component response regulator